METGLSLIIQGRYNDVADEVRPVIAGYRLVLQYKLLRTRFGTRPSAAAVLNEKERLRHILSAWINLFEQTEKPRKLAFIFRGVYSDDNLDCCRLEGHDELVSRYLQQVSSQLKFRFYFANISCTAFDDPEDEASDLTYPFFAREWSLSKAFDLIYVLGLNWNFSSEAAVDKSASEWATIDKEEILRESVPVWKVSNKGGSLGGCVTVS